jgi:hypothetical protein
MGVTNVNEITLPAGNVTLTFIKDGQAYAKDVVIKEGENDIPVLKLETLRKVTSPAGSPPASAGAGAPAAPAPSASGVTPGIGSIFISTIPSRCEIWIDNKKAGTSNMDILKLPVGRVVFTFMKDGKSATKEWTIEAGKNPSPSWTLNLE